MLALRSCLLLSCLTAVPSLALADHHEDSDDVPAVSSDPDGLVAVRRGIQGPAGLLSARVTLGINLSSDLVGKPISLAPDIYYAVTDRFQLGLVHDGPMRWQSRPGAGLCLTGQDGGCPHVYDNAGVDAMLGLVYGNQLHLSAHGALYVTSFDAGTAMVAVGAAAKLHLGDALALFADFQLGFFLDDRAVNDDGLFMPIELQYQVGAPTTLKVLSGVSGSLSAFGDTVEVPLGLGLVRNLGEHLDVGARFSFDNLLGHQTDGVGRADARSLSFLLTMRR
ncbi:MAG TPA: hypothetical protein VHE35_15655 [Kofleriaceae bacterium]|nr:hypothetical protein [Kofleriaceae bacterium]